MDNLFLEDILELLAAHGLPNLHRFSASKRGDHRDFTTGGDWTCAVRTKKVPHDINPYPDDGYHSRESRMQDPISFQGKGKTPREAARMCLERMQSYQETGWYYLWPEELHPSRKKPPRERIKVDQTSVSDVEGGKSEGT